MRESLDWEWCSVVPRAAPRRRNSCLLSQTNHCLASIKSLGADALECGAVCKRLHQALFEYWIHIQFQSCLPLHAKHQSLCQDAQVRIVRRADLRSRLACDHPLITVASSTKAVELAGLSSSALMAALK